MQYPRLRILKGSGVIRKSNARSALAASDERYHQLAYKIGVVCNDVDIFSAFQTCLEDGKQLRLGLAERLNLGLVCHSEMISAASLSWKP